MSLQRFIQKILSVNKWTQRRLLPSEVVDYQLGSLTCCHTVVLGQSLHRVLGESLQNTLTEFIIREFINCRGQFYHGVIVIVVILWLVFVDAENLECGAGLDPVLSR